MAAAMRRCTVCTVPSTTSEVSPATIHMASSAEATTTTAPTTTTFATTPHIGEVRICEG